MLYVKLCCALKFAASYSRGISPAQTAKLGFQTLTKIFSLAEK